MDPIAERVRADLERQGFHLGVIPPEAGTPGWAFTIGLVERFEHPELLAFAPNAEFLHGLVGNLARRVRDGDRFEEGPRYPGILSGREVALRRVEPKWIPIFLGNVAWHYGNEDFAALQCYWPDRAGRLPWEEDFDPRWRDAQPRLDEHATHLALSETLLGVLRKEGAL